MGENPVGQDGVEERFREAMAGLLRRLQAYESDPTLEELYLKYGTAPNGTAPRPVAPAPRPAPNSGETRRPVPGSSGEGRALRPGSGEARRAGGSGETRPSAAPRPGGSGETPTGPTRSASGESRPGGSAEARPGGSGETRPSAASRPAGSGETRPSAASRPAGSGETPTRAGASGEIPSSGEARRAQPAVTQRINTAQLLSPESPSPVTESPVAASLASLPPLPSLAPLEPVPPPPADVEVASAEEASLESSEESYEEVVLESGEEVLEEVILEEGEEILEEVVLESGEEILEEVILEEGEEILEEEIIDEEETFEPTYESEEPVPSEEGAALPDLSSLPPLPPLQESGEFERVPSRNSSMELPGGYTGQATMFSTAPAMPPAQPAGAAFAPPVGRTTTRMPVANLMTPAPPPPAAERPLTKEDEDGIAKRRVARIKCDYVAPSRSEKGDNFEVRITDLAIEGAGISAAVPLERGQVLTISQPTSVPGQLGQPVQGRLMWVQSAGGRTEAGVMFIDSHEAMSTSWVVELLDQLTGDENQNLMEDKHLAEKKETLTVRAESKESGVKAVGRLLNLGLGSAKVSLDGEYKKNSKVDIILGPYQELEALLLPGQVLSVRDDDEEDRWVHDIRFLDKSSHQTGVLGRYVLALLQESDI